MSFLDKITHGQLVFLIIISIPSLIVFFFPTILDGYYIISAIIINITFWCWIGVIYWNIMVEKQELKLENQKLKSLLEK